MLLPELRYVRATEEILPAKRKAKTNISEAKMALECCDVCALSFAKHIETGMKPITCSSCGLRSHLYCYGFMTPIRMDDTHGAFTCDECQSQSKQQCCVCSGKGGLKRKILNSNEYVHPLCGLLDKSIGVEDVLGMKFLRRETQVKNTQKCDLCGHQGAQQRCFSKQSKVNCKSHVHMFCLVQKIKDAKLYTLEDPLEELSWEFYLEGPWDLENVVLSEGCQTLSEDIKQEALTIMQKYLQIEQDLSNKKEDNTKQKRNTRTPNKKPEDERMKNISQAIETYFVQFNSEMSHRAEEEVDQISLIHVACSSHKGSAIYCSCRGQENDINMVLCETCMDWYHYKCQGVKQSPGIDEHWICGGCKDWEDIRENEIIKEQTLEEIQMKESVKIVPEKMKFHFVDLILFAILAQRLMDQLQMDKFREQKFQTVQKILQVLPFQNVLTQRVQEYRQRSQLTEFLTDVIQKIDFKNEALFQPLSYFDTQMKLIPAAAKHNESLIQALQKITTLFNELETAEFFKKQLKLVWMMNEIKEIVVSQRKVGKEEWKNILEYCDQNQNLNYQEFSFVMGQHQMYNKLKSQLSEIARSKSQELQKVVNNVNELNSFFEDEDIDNIMEKAQMMGVDLDFSSIEEFFELQLRVLIQFNKAKPEQEHLQQLINQMEQLVFTNSWMQQMIVDLANWVQIINQPPRQNDLEEFVRRVKSVPIRCNETYLEQYCKMSCFKIQVQQLKETSKDDDESGSGDIVNVQTPITKISLKKIQSLLNYSLQINSLETPFLQELLNNFNRAQDELTHLLNNPNFNESTKKQVLQSIHDFNKYDLPELEQLQQRIKILNEVQDMLSKRITLVQYMQLQVTVKDNNIDENILSSLDSEYQKALNLKQQIEDLLADQIITEDKILRALGFLAQIQACRIELKQERADLVSLQQSVEFIEELYREGEMEIEHENNNEEGVPPRGPQTLSDKIEILQKVTYGESHLPQLTKIITKYEAVNHKDERISALSRVHSQFVWQHQVDQMFAKMDLNEQIEIEVIENLFDKEEFLINPTRLREFKQIYLQNTNLVQNMISQLQLQQLLSPSSIIAIQDWLQLYEKVRMPVSGGIWNSLNTLRVWAQFTLRYLTIFDKPKVTYNAMMALKDIAQRIRLPNSSQALQGLLIFQQSFHKAHSEYQRYLKDREAFLELQSLPALQKVDKIFKKKTIYSQALIILKNAQNCRIMIDTSVLEQDIHKFNQLTNEFQHLVSSIDNADWQQLQDITEQMKDITEQVSRQPLTDHDLLNQTKNQNLKIRCVAALKGYKPIEYTKLKLRMEQQIINEPWVIEINNVLHNVEVLLSQIQNNTPYTFVEAENLLKRLLEIKVVLINDCIDTMQQTVSEASNIKKKYADMVSTTNRVKEHDVRVLLDQCDKVKVQLEEQKLLQGMLSNFQELKSQFNQIKTKPQLIPDFDKAYSDCKISIPEADLHLKEYHDFKTKLHNIETKLKSGDPQIHQIKKEFDEIRSIFAQGQLWESVRLKIWLLQVAHLKQLNTYSCILASQLLEQGYDVLHQQIYHRGQEYTTKKMKEPILYLEDIITKVKNYLLSILQMKENLDHLVDGKVEMMETLIEMKHLDNNSKRQLIESKYNIKKPFENWSYYYTKYVKKTHINKNQSSHQQQQPSANREPNKRKVVAPHKDVDFIYEKPKPEFIEEPKPIKKVKIDEQAQKAEKQMQVSQSLRDEKKTRLLELLRLNPHYQKYDKHLDGKVKEMENQIFGDHHKNKKSYNEKFEEVFELLRQIYGFKYLSERLMKKNFSAESVGALIRKQKEGGLYQSELKLVEQIKNNKSKTEKQPSQSNQQQTSMTPYNPLVPQPQIQRHKQPLQQPAIQQANFGVAKKSIVFKNDSDEELLKGKFKQTKPTQNDILEQILEGSKPEPPLRTSRPPLRKSSSESSSSDQNKRRSSSPNYNDSTRRVIDHYEPSGSSSELPEYPQKQSGAILFDPDQEEARQQLPKSIVIQYSEQYVRVCKLKIKRKDKDKNSLHLELFSQEHEHKFKDFSKMFPEFQEKQFKDEDQNNIMLYLKKMLQTEKFRMVTGFIYPETFQELSEMNALAEQIKDSRSVRHIQVQNVSVATFILAHQDQLIKDPIFQNFSIPKDFVTKSKLRNRDKYLIKLYGKIQSNLAFIIYAKDINVKSLSSFQPIQPDPVQFADPSEIRKLIESYKKKDQQTQPAPPPVQMHLQQNSSENMEVEQFEPVTSEEEDEVEPGMKNIMDSMIRQSLDQFTNPYNSQHQQYQPLANSQIQQSQQRFSHTYDQNPQQQQSQWNPGRYPPQHQYRQP